MKKKVRIGVFGLKRGSVMAEYCIKTDHAELVAVCDKDPHCLRLFRLENPDRAIGYYTDFDEFFKHDMDAVVLANYGNEHAPYAIRCLNAGRHVFSEVLPAANMKEAVELVEAAERSDAIYAYGENYSYMNETYEMRKLYREGRIGEFEYGEGEYIHNTGSSTYQLNEGGKVDHWRCCSYATFYCTHSLGPVIHITGLRPVSVIGLEGGMNSRNLSVGRRYGQFGMELVTFENGAIYKSIHGALMQHSVWYSLYGSGGRMESTRQDAGYNPRQLHVHTLDNTAEGKTAFTLETYEPKHEFNEEAKKFGHGGSDYYTMYNFIEKIQGNPQADTIDVYEAMDMALPGLFAYRSILAGGKAMEIPNLRDKAQRDLYRNDTLCSFPAIAGDQYVPSFSKGDPVIPPEIYEAQHEKYFKEREEMEIKLTEGERKLCEKANS